MPPSFFFGLIKAAVERLGIETLNTLDPELQFHGSKTLMPVLSHCHHGATMKPTPNSCFFLLEIISDFAM